MYINAPHTRVSSLEVFGIVFLSMPLAIVGNNFCVIWDDRERVIFIERFKEHFLHFDTVTRKRLQQARESSSDGVTRMSD